MSKEQNIVYMSVPPEGPEHQEKEITFVELLEIIWNDRKILFLCLSVFFAVGFFHYLTEPEEYESEAILLQENNQQAVSGFQLFEQLGGLGPRNIDDGSISSSLYPKVIESIEFQHNLLLNEVEFSGSNEKVMLYKYFINTYEKPFRDRFYQNVFNFTIGLPATLLRIIQKIFKKDSDSSVGTDENSFDDLNITQDGDILVLSPDVRSSIAEMRKRVAISIDQELINVTSRMPDPKAAAELNSLLIDQVQDYVTNYRIEKARKNLEYVEQQYQDVEDRYNQAQRELAKFQDENRGQLTAIARIEEERLQNQRTLTFSLYDNLAQRREDARLRLQEDTPVYSKLQKPNLPHTPIKSSPIVVIGITIAGGIFGIIWILIKNLIVAFKQRDNSSKN